MLIENYHDLAQDVSTYCTQAMIDAQDPRCVLQTPYGPMSRLPLAIDHVLLNRKWSDFLDGDNLFANAAGISDHAGLEAHGLLWSFGSLQKNE